MSIIANIKKQAISLHKTIVLAEGLEPRVLDATVTILKEKIAKIILVGDKDKIVAALKERGISANENCEIVDPAADPRLDGFVQKYYDSRKAKGMELAEAEKSMRDPLFFGAMLVKEGVAHGMVAGAINTTANVLRSGIRIIGTKPGTKTVSSYMVMITKTPALGSDGVVIFADPGVNPDLTAEMMADIAISSAENGKALLGIEPKVAMLSFSTKGSAKSESTEKVVEATAIAHEKAPELMIDGELQLDAAIIPEVGERKAPGSNVAGHANILIFPNLDSANIGYKLVERFGGAMALGPILQGFAKPVNDLSRGCSAEDIVNVTAITSVQN